MLSEEQDQCMPGRAAFWRSADGMATFHAMVEAMTTPAATPTRERSAHELLMALRASDFAPAHEVDERVHTAARTLAARMASELTRIAFHQQFISQPQPARPSVVYGERETRARDSLAAASIGSTPFWGDYLREQRALMRR